MQNLIDCNRYTSASVWNMCGVFTVMFGHDDPSVGVKEKSFKLQRDAIAWIKENAPTLDIWIERSDHFQRVHKS